jgi:hypothetical protein
MQLVTNVIRTNSATINVVQPNIVIADIVATNVAKRNFDRANAVVVKYLRPIEITFLRLSI